MISKEAFYAVERKIEKVDLPGGDFIFVKEMTAEEKTQFELTVYGKRDEAQEDENQKDKTDWMKIYKALVVVFTACDEEGNNFFDLMEYLEVNKRPTSMIDRIVEKASAMNALTKKDKEELLKN